LSIAREGYVFIGTLLGLGAVLLLARWHVAGAIALVLGLFTTYFFRDPERAVPADPKLVLSPADGRVVLVTAAPDAAGLGAGATQVSIFLSIFDVHVNRAPMAGRVADVTYKAGAFLPAFNHEASDRNEQNRVTIEGPQGRVVFTQIAGLIARRIVFKKRVGDAVAAGERVGLIRFGSRVDVFVPAGHAVKVKVGDRVSGGTSVIAERP
jgi:phosphatidylserine decarboxylase